MAHALATKLWLRWFWYIVNKFKLDFWMLNYSRNTFAKLQSSPLLLSFRETPSREKIVAIFKCIFVVYIQGKIRSEEMLFGHSDWFKMILPFLSFKKGFYCWQSFIVYAQWMACKVFSCFFFNHIVFKMLKFPNSLFGLLPVSLNTSSV